MLPVFGDAERITRPTLKVVFFFYRATLCYRYMRSSCVFVCVSVTLRYCIKTAIGYTHYHANNATIAQRI